MNCANHPDRERAAFCQHCGKPLCTDCVRNVGTSTFCEPCLSARVHGPAPAGSYAYPGYAAPGRPVGAPVPPPAPGEPSPGLAALLGLIPGVGAMYNEQYGKGIVHLIVFAVLVSLSHDVGIFGLFVAGWVCYMVVEAYHTARARRDGTPLPNPFGLNDISERFGFGRSWPGSVPPAPYGQGPVAPTPPAADPVVPPSPYSAPGVGTPASGPTAYFHQGPDGSQTYSAPGAYFHQAADGSQTYAASAMPPYAAPPMAPIPPMPPYGDGNLSYSRRLPSGAVWLIALGLLFLVGNVGVFHAVPGRLFGPFLVIGVGVWMFVRRMTSSGQSMENDGTALYRWRLGRALSGAAWVFLVGVIWLLDVLHILRWSTSWPLFLIAGGVMLILRRTMVDYGPGYLGYPTYPGAVTTPPPAATVVVAEAAPVEASQQDEPGHGQEGR